MEFKRITGEEKVKAVFFVIFFLVFVISDKSWALEITPSTVFENENVFRPTKIAAGGEQILLLDRGDQTVKILDKKGTILKKIGEKGQGPAQMLNAADFLVSKGNVIILDAGGNKLEIFSLTDGKSVETRKITVSRAFKFCSNNGSYYTAALKYLPGEKLITELVEDKTVLTTGHTFLECTPFQMNDRSRIYKNFGLITAWKNKIYFAYIVSNKVVEFSPTGKRLRELRIPLESLDLTKLPQGNNMILKSGVNYDIRAKNEGLYVLSRDKESKHSVIFKLEDGKFKEMYRMKESLISFDIGGKKIWAIEADNYNVLVYKTHQ